jgi:myo-inositol-hexaphosphate 3-phosphohydrolase
MLQIYLPKIIRSIALDSFKKISKKSYLKKKDVHRFLRQIHQANKQKRKVVEGTLGEELQFNSESVAGSILYHKEQTVHFSAFVKENKTTLPQYEYEDKVA